MGGEKVLLVDDDENTRLLYQEELEGEGYSVVTSEGEESIVEVIRRERPQVVLLDINYVVKSADLGELKEKLAMAIGLIEKGPS
jgi:DNA-binding NtrC family response regulator